ncbi:kinase-like domain-containing protein [Gigaspora rosea]|uniref:Kinase-like domain-containing protein n=1 Tax=Gigaspora rosea TaxID=44941 RepID=A0A397VTV1_9GLOM|nr:kinase-like domain-containing protein [Gigaspora rosea]
MSDKCLVKNMRCQRRDIEKWLVFQEQLRIFIFEDEECWHDKNRDFNTSVALKMLYSGSFREFNEELKMHCEIREINPSFLKCYGISKDSEGNYILVLEYAKKKSLSKNLKDIVRIEWEKKTVKNKIEIVGVLPYIAPKVLLRQSFTQAADIYSFGVIMTEISTGKRPFDEYKHNTALAVKICMGLRPELAPSTPNFYVELAMQCMDPDPRKRPTADNILSIIDEWIKYMEASNEINEFKRQCLEADKIIKEVPIIVQILLTDPRTFLESNAKH